MLAVLNSLGMFIVDLFKSRRRPEAENLDPSPQLSVALRRAPPRLEHCDDIVNWKPVVFNSLYLE